ncbi:MAG: ABC1 kinase family protein [Acidimicrobiales bacterium]
MTLVVLVSRRLSGLRIGIARSVLAGLVGLAAYLIFGLGVQTRAENPWAFTTIQVGLSVLVTTGFLVLAEALVPQGSTMGFMTWRRAVKRRIGRSRRYVEISSIAFRHGLVPYNRRRRRAFGDQGERAELSRSLRLALEEGGVTFVKLGQLLSTRRDLLPPEFIDELTRLQERASPEPWEHVERVLDEELGGPWSDVFAELDPEPLASASIAQVHAAVLHSGESVVVKVQRPGIRQLIERDMDIVARIARSLERRTRWARRLGAADLANGFARAMQEELDFRIEARNMLGVATATARRGDDSVHVPALWEAFGSQRVLVMERLDGISLGTDGRLIDELGLDRVAVARSLLRWLLAEVVLDGVFHADPHPGNILLSFCFAMVVLAFSTSARSVASIRRRSRRCSSCSPPSTATTPPELGTRWSTSSPPPRMWTSDGSNGRSAISWCSTSAPRPAPTPRCSPTCFAWCPTTASPFRPRWRRSSGRWPPSRGRWHTSRPASRSSRRPGPMRRQ